MFAASALAGRLPEHDAVAAFRPAAAASAHLARVKGDGSLRRLGTASQVDERFGVPTFVWANRSRGAVAAARATGPRMPEQAAREHLERLAPLYRLGAADARSAVLRRVHDTGEGGIVVSFAQEIDGVEVFRDALHLLLDRDLELVAASGFLPGASLAARGRKAFRHGAAEAIAAALADLGTPAAGAIRARGPAAGRYEIFDVAGGAVRPVRAKRVLFHLPGSLEPAWYLEIVGEEEGWSYVVAAGDKEILFRHDLTAADSYTYRVWAGAAAPFLPHDGPQGTAPTPHPTGTPNSYAPPLTSPSLVSLANGPISTLDPWLPPAATETAGNNVDAYADLVSPDGRTSGDFRATTTAPNTFDRVYDTSLAPWASTNQRMASITQLFFTNNFLHDWFYDAGFDEASGNAQSSNFGRGGLENDRILAEAQDYSGSNNANMLTPSDGASPRMQMYVFNPPSAAKLTIGAPPSLAGDYAAGSATFAPSTFSVTAAVVLVNDGSGVTTDACQPPVNALAGKIALYDAGTCDARTKAANAAAAGAVGAIHVHDVPGAAPPALSGSPAVGIPVISISYEVGQAIKTELGAGVVSATIARQAQLSRDGTIDNQIVAHEWAHYLSNRLVGDANGLTTLQAGGMGEGWSDFCSVLLTVRPEDALAPGNASYEGVYAMASYALSRSFFPNNAYYFGIRRYPYSTDLARNPLTFRHIENGVPLPVGPPVAFGADGASNAAVHRTGEVWCNTLWECYAALIRDSGRLTFDQARDRMRAYLVAGLKMTPNGPTFTEARDALLAAAYASDLADFDLFCAAFARRGLGSGAVSPDRHSWTNAGVVESFACGGALAFVEASLEDDAAWCDADGYVDDGETGWLRLTLHNSGATTLSATTATVTSTNPNVSFPNGNTVAFDASAPFTDVAAAIPVSLAGAVGLATMTFQISCDDPGLLAGPVLASFTVYANGDESPSSFESVEAIHSPWTMNVGANSVPETWRRHQNAPTDHRFFAPDPGGRGDLLLTSPPLEVPAAGSFGFTFSHAYSFETSSGIFWDGGVLELSADGGATWADIGSFASMPYGGILDTTAGNPLGGRSAWVGESAGWPALQPVSVNLGTAWAGDTVRIRFRLGADAAVNGPGWHVDDLAFSNLDNLPFAALGPEIDPCATPLAVGGAARELSLVLAGRNPVEGAARLGFALPAPARVSLAIFDVGGRRVATLASGEYAAGRHEAVWERGRTAGPGVYFARLAAGDRVLTRRIVVTR